MKTNIDFTVIYEDDFIAVLNKRSGLSVASDRFDPEAPRLDVLASKSLGELYAVHRIDKDTSGAVLYARTAQAHKVLCEAFEKRRVRKCYHALVYGRPLWETLHVDLPLLADADARHRTLVHLIADPFRGLKRSRLPDAPTKYACTRQKTVCLSYATRCTAATKNLYCFPN